MSQGGHRAVVKRSLVLLLVVGAGCSAFDSDSSEMPEAPSTVDNETVCDDWLQLSEDDREGYALHRLAELRANDGIEYARDRPDETQVGQMQRGMEAECRQPTLGVAAVWRVAHDVYTNAFESRTLLE